MLIGRNPLGSERTSQPAAEPAPVGQVIDAPISGKTVFSRHFMLGSPCKTEYRT
jgi:hypothetical protein